MLMLLLFPALLLAQITYTPQGKGKLPTNYSINCIYPLNDNIVWALASESGAAGPVKFCLTTDGGANWNVSDIDNTLIGLADDLFVEDANTAYANLEDNTNGTQWYKTRDGGAHWYKLPNFSSTLLYMFNQTEGAMISVQSGLYSTDSFHSATTILSTQQGGPPKVFGQNLLSGPNSKCLTDSGLFFIYPKGYVVRTQDKGKTWQGFLTGLNANRSTVGIAASGNTIITIQWPLTPTIKKGMAKSTDGGHTWQNLSDSIPSAISQPMTICAVPNQPDHFVLTGTSELYHSLNGGQTWTDLAPPGSVTGPSNGVFIMSSTNTGWYGMNAAASGDAIIVKCSMNFVNGIKSPQKESTGIAIYPNPAVSQLQIQCKHNSNFNLYTSTGVCAMSGNLIGGTNSLDIAALPAGTYAIHITNSFGAHSQLVIITGK